jgi:hypothetical protein
MLATKQNGTVNQGIKLIHRLALEKVCGRAKQTDIRHRFARLFRMQRQHGKIALSVAPVAGRVEDIGPSGPSAQFLTTNRRAAAKAAADAKQDAAEHVRQWRRYCQIPALFPRPAQAASRYVVRQKGRPAALPGIGLRGGGEIVIKIEPKLRLVAPLVQTR